MKKLFAVLAVAGVLVACNDSATKEGEVKTDSPAAATVDSPAVTTTPVDSTAAQAVDSTKAAVDTTKK